MFKDIVILEGNRYFCKDIVVFCKEVFSAAGNHYFHKEVIAFVRTSFGLQ